MTSWPRRRLVTAAVLLLAAIAVFWMLSRRIDHRLVGEWVNVDPTGFAVCRRFDADGTHTYSSDPAKLLPGGGGSWSVSGDTLTFRQRTGWFAGTGSLRRWLFDVVNFIREPSAIEHYTIQEVTPDLLRIKSHSGAPVELYRRKPSG